MTQTIIAGIPEHRLKDVVYLSVEDWEYPFGLNLFECPPESTIRTKAAVASCVAHAFEKIWGLGVSGQIHPDSCRIYEQ